MPNSILAFLIGMLCTAICIPSIIAVARKKVNEPYIKDPINAFTKFPAIGGISVFVGSIVSFLIFFENIELFNLQFFILSLLLIFLLGLKDDFDELRPIFKLIGQIAIVYIFCFTLKLDINAIQFSNQYLNFIPASLLIIFILNSYNFLDGINALCASISIITLITLGSYFFITQLFNLTIISFGLSGALMAFLYYNITPARIFMGDTGSMYIGLIIGFLCVQFLNSNPMEFKMIPNSPAMLYGIVVIPVFDAIRVMTERILKLKSPFLRDRNHIHHWLLQIGFSHMKATILLVLMNLVFILIAINFQNMQNINLILLLSSIALLLTLFIKNKSRNLKLNKQIQNSI